MADDHPLIRLGLELALESAPDFTFCGAAENGIDAVALAVEVAPDVIVLDVSMPGGDGVEATRRIRELVPSTRVVILTWLETAQSAAYEAGADAFVLKNVRTETLLEQIRAVSSMRS